jgi:hypothetical protein
MTAGRWEIIKWWELRRIPYTIVVGGVGILSYFITNSIIENYAQTGEEYLNPASLLIGVPVAIIVSNVCYTFGWIVELARKRTSPEESRGYRVFAFYLGVIFSILVMSFPMVALLSWVRHKS